MTVQFNPFTSTLELIPQLGPATAVDDLTTSATTGTLPTPDGTVTIADADAPTVGELLEYCVELEAKLEAALARLRTLNLIETSN